MPPLIGQVEREFLFPLLLGESIAPYRALLPACGVIPRDSNRAGLLNAKSALDEGYPHLARWLRRAERLWNAHRTSEMSFSEQLDYYGKLSSQFPIAGIRVVYAASGTLPCALVVQDRRAIIEHANYWSATNTIEEAHYLTAILNSETARLKVCDLQSQGQWGARHFDKVMFSLPIPRFDIANSLHQDIASVSALAEQAAKEVVLEEGVRFQKARKIIREALNDAELSLHIEKLVYKLLNASKSQRH